MSWWFRMIMQIKGLSYKGGHYVKLVIMYNYILIHKAGDTFTVIVYIVSWYKKRNTCTNSQHVYVQMMHVRLYVWQSPQTWKSGYHTCGILSSNNNDYLLLCNSSGVVKHSAVIVDRNLRSEVMERTNYHMQMNDHREQSCDTHTQTHSSSIILLWM